MGDTYKNLSLDTDSRTWERICKETHETAKHLLCHCEAISLKRMQHVNTGLLEPKEVHKTSPRKVVKFMRELLSEGE
jgi:hypothetical protein